jgi:uncharacterized protein YuzE
VKITATYDADGDTAYVQLGTSRPVTRTLSPTEDIAIDLDEEGRVVGIEFVTASVVLDPSTFDQDPRQEKLIGVSEIAAMFGKHKQNVAQHYTRRRDFPEPVAVLPTGRYWRRGDIERWYEQSRIRGMAARVLADRAREPR